MAQWLKQSTAYTFQLGPIVDATDGVTPLASETIAATAVRVSKNGAAFASKNDSTALTGTGDANGYYDCVLDATDTGDLGPLEVELTHSGALPVWRTFQVVPANVHNALMAGSDKLFVDAVELNSSAAAAAQLALSSATISNGEVYDDAGTYAPTNGGGALVFYSDTLAFATADAFNGRVVYFTSGPLNNQALAITDYEKVSTYGKFTCSEATTVPADGNTFIVL